MSTARDDVTISNRTYAEVIAEKYEGEIVELLFDSDWGSRMYAEYTVNNKPVLICMILGAEANCLDIRIHLSSNAQVVDKEMSVNAWSILSVSKYDKNSQVLAFSDQILGKQ